MARILAVLTLIATCGISLKEASRGPAGDRPGSIQNLRTAINPAGLVDCAFNWDAKVFVSSDRVVDRDENDNEDDFREVGEPPPTYLQVRNLICRTIDHPISFITPQSAPAWRTPLLC